MKINWINFITGSLFTLALYAIFLSFGINDFLAAALSGFLAGLMSPPIFEKVEKK